MQSWPHKSELCPAFTTRKFADSLTSVGSLKTRKKKGAGAGRQTRTLKLPTFFCPLGFALVGLITSDPGSTPTYLSLLTNTNNLLPGEITERTQTHQYQEQD